MPQTLTKSSKTNPCPVCNRTKDADCRISADGLMVLCHTHRDADPQIPGWKFIKPIAAGQGTGMFVVREKVTKKPADGKPKKFEWFYPDTDGRPMLKVEKWVKPNGDKSWSQYHWTDRGWVSGGVEDRNQLHVYRYQEVKAAIDRGEVIWWVEGEACADALWKIGIPSCTSLGGAKNLRSSPNYIEDMNGASIIVAPDKDTNGVEYASQLADLMGDKVVGWYYAFDNSLWGHLNHKDGADIEDEMLEKKLTRDDLIAGITARKDLTHKQASSEPPASSQTVVLSSAKLIEDVDKLIVDGVFNGHLRAEIAVLAHKYKLAVSAIWDCYQQRLADAEFEEDRFELTNDIRRLIDCERARLNVKEILPNPSSGAIHMTAALMGVMSEAYMLAILTAVSSLQNSKTRIDVCPMLSWMEPPNLYAAIVSESSQRKTPILSTSIFRPLRKLQEKASLDHELALDQYDRDSDRYAGMKPADRAVSEIKKPVAPVQKLYTVSDASMEGLIEQAIAHPQKTTLYIRDELSAVFGDLNRYRGGRGSDRQMVLEAFNGATVSSVRAGRASKFQPDVLLSMFGGVQPTVLQKIMKDGEDADGLWGRFLYVIQPTVEAPHLPSYAESRSHSLEDILTDIYARIEELPAVTYKFETAAFDLFADYRQHLERMRVNRGHSPLIRHFAGKLQGITARLALNLHTFWAVSQHVIPSEYIGEEMMIRAIKIAQFCLSQTQLLGGETAAHDLKSTQIFRLRQILTQCESITVREVQRQVRCPSADAARSLIAHAVDLGFARWVDKKSIAIAHPDFTDTNYRKDYQTPDIPAPSPPTVDRPPSLVVPIKVEVPVAVIPKPATDDRPAPYPKAGQMVRCIAHTEGKKKVPELKMPVSMAMPKNGVRKTADGWTIEPEDWLKIWFPAD